MVMEEQNLAVLSASKFWLKAIRRANIKENTSAVDTGCNGGLTGNHPELLRVSYGNDDPGPAGLAPKVREKGYLGSKEVRLKRLNPEAERRNGRVSPSRYLSLFAAATKKARNSGVCHRA